MEGSLQGVVVGDGDAVEAFFRCGRQDLFDPVSAVREARMDVKVESEGTGSALAL
ncbi:MAG TPA: hypothetical protein PLZ42_06640 [Methanothrix sp.]|nr:hypothetical protein [Methanothrix sp.]